MDSTFKEALETIEENRRKEWVGIPMNMGAMDKIVPFLEKKRYILIFGATGSGKSKIATKKFLIDPFLFSKRTGYKLKIINFSLEVPKHAVLTQIIAHFYYLKYGESHSKAFFDRDKPSNEVMQQVYHLEDYFLEFTEKVDIVDSISNPTGLLKYVEEYYSKNGKIIKPTQFTSQYVPNDDTHVIIITDTLNALYEEAGKTKFQTIFDYSLKYTKKRYVDFYGSSAISIQQSDKNNELSEYNFKGNKIEYKTMPNRSGLAECKQVINDVDLAYSIYSPHLYSIPKYPFDSKDYYDITKWQDNFRIWTIQKNRHAESAKEVALFFDGASAEVDTLPPPQEFTKTPNLYQKYLN